MNRVRSARTVSCLVAILGVLVFNGCIVRPTGALQQTQTQTVSYTQPVVYTQPAPVVVQRPVTVVYRTAPVVYRATPTVYRSSSNVMTPVRISVPGVVSAYSACAPGTSRTCDAYCGQGVQFCNTDGLSWGSCIESW